MSTKRSETLDSHLESHQTESVREKLSSLQALGIDPAVFEKFHNKIEGILDQNPESENVVMGEISKLAISLEYTSANYTRAFRSIITDSANNPDWNPDESLIA